MALAISLSPQGLEYLHARLHEGAQHFRWQVWVNSGGQRSYRSESNLPPIADVWGFSDNPGRSQTARDKVAEPIRFPAGTRPKITRHYPRLVVSSGRE
jgi:hypothetical protein